MLLLSLILAGPSLAAGKGGEAARPPYSPEAMAQVREVTEARFSPDGRELAFITDITGALEVWSVPVEGGWPVQLTFLNENAYSLRYSPDGKSIVFVSDFGGNERGDIFLAPSGGGEAVNLTKSTQAEASVRFSPDGGSLAYIADPQREFLYQLMVKDLKSGAVRQLTAEPVNVVEPVWSPDGRAIAATRTGDDQKGDLLLVDLPSGRLRAVAPPVPQGIIYPKQFSGNGKTLLSRARNAKGFMQLYLVDVEAGSGRFVGPDEWDVEEAALHPKAGIFFTRNVAGANGVYRMTGPKEGDVLLEAAGRVGALEVDDAGSKVAYIWGDSRRPMDVWVMDIRGRKPRQVTRSLAGGVVPETLARGEMIRYASFDDTTIHGLLLRPPHPRLGTPPPAVVVPHGGPNGQSFDSFSPLRQALAEAGFAVIVPNYRGSTGFGKAFEDANNMDWGGGDIKDLIWAVQRLGEKGEVDIRRVGITGGSYGGYLTLMALAKSPAVWAAGVEAYGMPDLVQDYELSKDRFGDWYATEMGTPATQPALFKDRSAIHFIDGIRAPLLIFQGANDTNVPLAESQLIFSALKKRGGQVEMVVYPDEGHGFTRRKNLVDYYRRTVEFFVEHLGVPPR